MTPSFLSRVKRAALTEALQRADYVQLVCTTREPGTVLPERFYKDPTITLHIGARFAGTIGLELDEWGVCGTLSFDRVPFYTKLPWTCVWHINHPNIPVGMMFSIEPGSAGLSEQAQNAIPTPPAAKPALKLVK